jgi:hypothetical protein
MKVSNSVKEVLIIIFIIAVSVPLRFVNLGYSELQDDEKKAFYAYSVEKEQSPIDFFLKQRKGPMQFLISEIPFSITGDFRNELSQRLPFTIINTLSVIILYKLLLKLTNGDSFASLFGALLYATNGFFVGFSRIAQYQSLNLFFSFLSLYFFADLATNKDKLFRSSLIGTLMFCFSVLSHWDAVFYLVPTVYFLIQFLRRKDIEVDNKKKLFLYNFYLGCVVLLPFMLPYFLTQLQIQSNLNYLQKRVGYSVYNFNAHRYIFELYNPYITLPLLLALISTSIFFIKKNYIYLLWFIVNLLLIRFFMAKPGTHIYNYVIPAVFLISINCAAAFSKLSKFTLPIAFIAIISISGVLFYQSYFLFVDHAQEYPWDAKVLFDHTTEPYKNKEILTFGFPHYRNWKGVNDYINSRNNNCTYITNEGKEESQIYIDAKFGKQDSRCYYVISVLRPFVSTRDGIVYGEAYGKPVLYSYAVGEKELVKVYKVLNGSNKVLSVPKGPR